MYYLMIFCMHCVSCRWSFA